MSQHLHSSYVYGCYRCELSRDEMERGLRDEVAELRAIVNSVEVLADRDAELDELIYPNDAWLAAYRAVLDAWRETQ